MPKFELEKEIYCGPYKLLIDEFSSVQPSQKEFKFKIVGSEIPQDCDYLLTVFVRPRLSGNLSLISPDIAEFGVRVSAQETEDLKTEQINLRPRLDSVKASLNNSPRINIKKISPENWASTFPEPVPLDHNNSTSWTWNLEVKLWLRFSISSEAKALEKFTSLFVQQRHCDIHFKLLDGKRVGAHFLILVSRSPLFAAMYGHEIREADRKDIKVSYCEPFVFRQFLHFLYSGRLPEMQTETSAKELYVVAHKYQVDDLVLECQSFLEDRIRRDNVIDLLMWSEMHAIWQLKEDCLKFIEKNDFRNSINSSEWRLLAQRFPHLHASVVHLVHNNRRSGNH